MSSPLIQCYNKGCGQKFDSSKNTNDSCTYHPGPTYFHDAYKIWKCCDKKSTDFSTWLSYKGCTKGQHNGEKPIDIVKQLVNTEIRPEKAEGIITWNGLNKPAERFKDDKNRELVTLKIEYSDAAISAIEEHKKLCSNLNNNNKTLFGAACKNNSCKQTYSDTMTDDADCFYHPGTAVFHEGMKYWSCCQRKTSNFSSFLDQVGCECGKHCWAKSEQINKVREDWFSRSGFIHINIYCKGALPESCEFKSDGLVLCVVLIHGFGDKKSTLNYELWGQIIPSESSVILGERKVELILKQADVGAWPKLLFDNQQSKMEGKN